MSIRKKTVLRPRRAALQIVPDTAALVAVLQAHALGEHDMTTSQVNVALSLLKIYAGKPVAGGEEVSGGSHEDALDQLA